MTRPGLRQQRDDRGSTCSDCSRLVEHAGSRSARARAPGSAPARVDPPGGSRRSCRRASRAPPRRACPTTSGTPPAAAPPSTPISVASMRPARSSCSRRGFEAVVGELLGGTRHEHHAVRARADPASARRSARIQALLGRCSDRFASLGQQASEHVRQQQDRQRLLLVTGEQRLDVEVQQRRDASARASSGSAAAAASTARRAADEHDLERPVGLLAGAASGPARGHAPASDRRERDYPHQALSKGSRRWAAARRSASTARTSSRTRSSRRSICSPWRSRSAELALQAVELSGLPRSAGSVGARIRAPAPQGAAREDPHAPRSAGAPGARRPGVIGGAHRA